MAPTPPCEEVVLRLERACRRLLTPCPEALEEAAAELERAESCLREFAGAAPAPCAPQPPILRELRRLTRLAELLLTNAETLQSGWARWLSVMTGGYTAQGQPAALESAPSVVIEG